MLIYKINEDQSIQIDDEKFQGLINHDLQKIINALKAGGFEVRIVGGAVRDILLGEKPRDIDLLTDATPDEVIFVLSQHEIESDVWGIRHGTVKAIINHVKYEITSSDFRMYKDEQGNLKIHERGTWEEDAKRRDFTINALNMELDGKVHDYVGGINDLKDRFIRPLPGFEHKIKNDPVVILRFFKMMSRMPQPKASERTIDIVSRNIGLLNFLDADRVEKELGNIRKGINAARTLNFMEKLGVMDILNHVLSKEVKK